MGEAIKSPLLLLAISIIPNIIVATFGFVIIFSKPKFLIKADNILIKLIEVISFVVLNLINIFIRQIFRVINSTSKILTTNLIASVLTIVSIDSIIKSFGINGVYLGTIFSQISVILLSLWFLNKSNKLVHR